MTADDRESPALSVVVPSVNGLTDLFACLDALAAEAARTPLEVLVIDRCGPAVRDQVRLRHPRVRIIEAAPGTTIPDLRAAGFAAARAPVVAVIEDHVLVPAGWAALLLAAQRRGERVVGGSVVNAATTRTVDWAAFLCEYGHLLPPLPTGPVAAITGNNTAYSRDLLHRFQAVTASGRWEDHLHAVLREHGIELFCRPEITVAHKKHTTIREYASQRYLYGRSFAAGRLRSRSWALRVGYGIAAVFLPPVLLVRLARRAWALPAYRAPFLRSLPLLPLFVTASAVGEAAGAWLGPGDALSRVR